MNCEEILRKEEETARKEFEKAKANNDAWLMNFWGSSLAHIEQVKQECKRLSNERMHRFEKIRENARASAECKYLKAKMKCDIQKSGYRFDSLSIGIFFLVLAYFCLILILCH